LPGATAAAAAEAGAKGAGAPAVAKVRPETPAITGVTSAAADPAGAS